MKKICYLPLILLFLACFSSCDDMEDIDTNQQENGTVQETGTEELYILSEGLFNLNNSTLMRYTFKDNKRIQEYFRTINRRGLGDTANDMAIYGSKLYIVVNVSSQIEVIDLQTGQSIKRIPMLKENGSARQPRNIAFHKNKAYVCSFDGTVARIDTTSLDIDGIVKVGRNPDGICVQNNKLYVSNSGGLDNPNYDNTVSVIDLSSFSETKKISVGSNPGRIKADKYGNVYVVVRGNITDGNYAFKRIDSQTDEVIETMNEQVLNFDIDDHIAYLYNYNYSTNESRIKVYDLNTQTTIRDQFITDGTILETPFGIHVNPYSGNVYITEAYNYQVTGDVLCFSPHGQLLFRLNDVGINPNTVVFSNESSQSNIDEPEEPGKASAYATKVLEYYPAPGQFMNTSATAYKDGFTTKDVLTYADELIKKKSILSLGGFGGYITIGFDHTIPNVTGAYDFKIYGNSYYNSLGKGGSSEPGIVLVSKDSNENGLPDDEWYELAGSEYYSDKVIRNYEITYYRPKTLLSEIQWKDNQNSEGVIPRNGFHSSNSYYPAWIEADEITYKGTRLPDNGINEGTGSAENWVQYPFPWGYADNMPNNSEFSQFKIDWAVDQNGQSVHLDGIDFVRIYSAINQVCGWTGEISTEISTIEDLHFE
ncbi:YncE family protein [Bacteroides sp. 224]|uniref:YncE family protein n=1 Tax=Bacteroides sp. 224 TaxID=2302936 RepID=UPI0013CF8DEE|nr:YncE family protein [Bacteroides sp. 224]NDV64865.1 YncE family protein [Bacteroides sp. 224]